MGKTPSLLVRIRDPSDVEAWIQFVDLYGPLVYWFGRKHGLQDSDAADLKQNVLHAVGSAVRRFGFDETRGTFRSWIFTVARNELYKWTRDHKQVVPGSGDTDIQRLLEQVPEKRALDGTWDRDYERDLMNYAMNCVRNEFRQTTWEAFWQTAVQGRRAKEVARQLHMSVGAIYVAKSRVLSRMKEEIRRLQGE